MKVDMRTVRESRGLVERAACRALYRLAEKVPAGQAIVELGAYCGRSTGWLVAGSKGAHVWSVDPWEDLADDAVTPEYAAIEAGYRNGNYVAAGAAWRAHVTACRITPKMCTPLQSTAIDVAASWSGPPVGLLFHDAVHSREAVVADLEAWLPHLARGCVVALHDAGNPEMGVVAGAGDVLPAAGFEWPARLYRWRKAPERRGLLVVRRPA